MDDSQFSVSSTVKLVVFLLLISLLSYLVGLYVEWRWFQSVEFSSVFTTIILNKIALYLIVFLFAFLFFTLNLFYVRRSMSTGEEPPYHVDEDNDVIYLHNEPSPWKKFLRGRYSRMIFLAVSAAGAFLVSTLAADNWIVVQQFLHRVFSGVADPIFNRDIGFYFFNLSFYHFLYAILMTTLVLTVVIVAAVHVLNASSAAIIGKWKEFSWAKAHLALLVGLIFILKAWGYKLNAYDILFTPGGLIYGAAYADVNARLIAYQALIIVSLIVAIIIIANIFIRRFSWIIYSIVAWLLIAVVLSGFYPAVIQKLVVQPNEFNKELPYIENAIKFTRQAYGLDYAENREFNIDYQLDIADPALQLTIGNIRLWDWQPLRTTYRNLQQLRPYYVFNDVDIDRYVVDGRYRQLMLSAREIDQSELPAQAQTWINQKLMYTHGYGVVVSPVTEIEEEGFPKFFIKDIPPVFSTDLTISRPEIYFGEKTDSYVIVNTKQQEFDYPMGDQNVYTTYEGKLGIKTGSIFNKLALAWYLKDYKMLLSSDITGDSQILMNRNIMTRIRKVAPYLIYDGDPYIVINNDGALYWMLDAYTVTDMYPYSQPFDNMRNNYLRNSVKIVTNAYTGEMTFYIADESDLLIQTYAAIFPGLYQPLASIPEGLQSHIRYPSDLFAIQADMYRTFHMTDPWVFYNKEDIWVIPNEVVEDRVQKMEPYYIIMHLPEEAKDEYILMIPFTPRSRLNMIAWMCVRMDGDNYGKMLVFDFPKQETIYGPEQIESRINQNTDIAQQLTLWDQRGSRIYRGNLLVIPLHNSILYVEPLYLQAEASRLPELKRVIAAFGNRVVMEETLEYALLSLFGQGSSLAVTPDGAAVTPGSADTSSVSALNQLAAQARQNYDRANEQLRAGDWAGYGESIKALGGVIARIEELVNFDAMDDYSTEPIIQDTEMDNSDLFLAE